MTLYNNLKKLNTSHSSYQTIANYILKHPFDVLNFSIHDFSVKVFTSPTSIIRFCKKIGFSGWSEFKTKLILEMDTFLLGDEQIDINFPIEKNQKPIEIATSIYQLTNHTLKNTYISFDVKQLELIASIINKADFISLWGIGDSLLFAQDFLWKIRKIGIIALCDAKIGFRGVPPRRNSEHEVAIVISIFGNSQESELLIRSLKKTACKIVLITTNPTSRFINMVDYPLVSINEENKFNKIAHYSSQIVIQFTLDVLYGLIFNLSE